MKSHRSMSAAALMALASMTMAGSSPVSDRAAVRSERVQPQTSERRRKHDRTLRSIYAMIYARKAGKPNKTAWAKRAAVKRRNLARNKAAHR